MRSLQASPLVFRHRWWIVAHELGVEPSLKQFAPYRPVGQERIGQHADGAAARRAAPAFHGLLLHSVGLAVARIAAVTMNTVTRIHWALRPIPSDT